MKALVYGFCLCFGVPALAHAQADTSTETRSAALEVNVQGKLEEAEITALRTALERELGRPVTLSSNAEAALRVQIDENASKRRATVIYRSEAGEVLTRSMDLPADRDRARDVIAWMAGNLTRNEAAELAAELGKTSEESTADAAKSEAKPATQPPSTTPAQPAAAPKSKATEPGEKSWDEFERWQGFAWDLSLFHPLTVFGHSERRVLNLELGLAYSNVGAIDGLGLNLFVHRVQKLRGSQIATIVTLAEDVTGAQTAVGAAFARDVRGAQVASGAAFARDVIGAQTAVGLNRARDVDGAQVTAGANVARSVDGVQFGIVNVARRVDGAQIGIVNIAEEVDGTAVGLVSLAKNGRVQPVVWANNSMPVNLAVKFIVGPIYTQIGGGYAPDSERARTEAGVGGHLRLQQLFFEPAIHFANTRDTNNWDKELRNDFIYRGAVGYDFKYVSLFAGAGLVHEVESAEPLEGEYFAGVSFF